MNLAVSSFLTEQHLLQFYYDGIPTDEDLKILRSTWDRRHKGSGNAQKLAIVTGGAKISMLSIPPEQAQFIAARKFQVSEIQEYSAYHHI